MGYSTRKNPVTEQRLNTLHKTANKKKKRSKPVAFNRVALMNKLMEVRASMENVQRMVKSIEVTMANLNSLLLRLDGFGNGA